MTRRLRTLSVLLILVGAAVALIGSTQTWVDVVLRGGAFEPLHVAGASVVPLLAPLSLAALALCLALTIVGPVLRYVFGALGVVIGAGLAAGAWRIVAETPVDAVASAVTEATGLAGAATVGGLIDSMTLTPWPVLTLAAAVMVIAGGALTLITAHRWPGAGRRFRTSPTTAAATGSRPHDAIDSWDDLSRGEDPTA